MLNPAQISQYKTQGFLVIKAFASHDECQMLRDRAKALVASSGPMVDPRSGFDTQSKYNKLVSQSYFMESTSKVSLFFDASALSTEGKLLKSSERAIIKIGHALHDFDPVFESYSHSSRMHEIAKSLGYKKPLIGQSRYFFRPSEIQITIPAHQDSTLLYTEPASCYLVWLALDDATTKNGCMWVSPGSHRAGVRERFMTEGGKGFLKSLGTFEPVDDASFIPVEVDEGDAVLLCGELFHKSGQNMSTGPRRAYALHFIEGHKTHIYPSNNWLQRSGGFGELRHIT